MIKKEYPVSDEYEYVITIKEKINRYEDDFGMLFFQNNYQKNKTPQLYIFLRQQRGYLSFEVLNYIQSLFVGYPNDYLFIYNINRQLKNGKMRIIHENLITDLINVQFQFNCTYIERLTIRGSDLQNNPERISLFKHISFLKIQDDVKKLKFDFEKTCISSFNQSYVEELEICNFQYDNMKESLLNLKTLKILNLQNLKSNVMIPEYIEQLQIQQRFIQSWKILNDELNSKSIDLQNFDLTNIIIDNYQRIKLIGCRLVDKSCLLENSIFANTKLPINLISLYIDNTVLDKNIILNLDLTKYESLTDITLKYFEISLLKTDNQSPTVQNCNIACLNQSKLVNISNCKLDFIELLIDNLEDVYDYLQCVNYNQCKYIKVINFQTKQRYFSKVKGNYINRIQLSSISKSLIFAFKIEKIYEKINLIINE